MRFSDHPDMDFSSVAQPLRRSGSEGLAWMKVSLSPAKAAAHARAGVILSEAA